MKDKLDKLVNECLQLPQELQNYNEQDLLNATLIFSHVFTDLSYQNYRKLNFTQFQSVKLAEESGKNIRQTILLATGIDMHKVLN